MQNSREKKKKKASQNVEITGKYAEVNKWGQEHAAQKAISEKKSSIDDPLPDETERLRAEGRLTYKDEVEQGLNKGLKEKKQARINIRISSERKEILEKWLREEREQHLAAGVRGIIVDFMKENNLI